MTQDAFFLLGMALLGVYAVGWTRRLAPAWSELPLKTLIATVAAAATVAASFAGAAPGTCPGGCSPSSRARRGCSPPSPCRRWRERARGRSPTPSWRFSTGRPPGVRACGACWCRRRCSRATPPARSRACRAWRTRRWPPRPTRCARTGRPCSRLGDAAAAAPAGAGRADRGVGGAGAPRRGARRDRRAAARRSRRGPATPPSTARGRSPKGASTPSAATCGRCRSCCGRRRLASRPTSSWASRPARRRSPASRPAPCACAHEAARLAPDGRRAPHVRALDAVGSPRRRRRAPARRTAWRPGPWWPSSALAFVGQLLLDRGFGPLPGRQRAPRREQRGGRLRPGRRHPVRRRGGAS